MDLQRDGRKPLSDGFASLLTHMMQMRPRQRPRATKCHSYVTSEEFVAGFTKDDESEPRRNKPAAFFQSATLELKVVVKKSIEKCIMAFIVCMAYVVYIVRSVRRRWEWATFILRTGHYHSYHTPSAHLNELSREEFRPQEGDRRSGLGMPSMSLARPRADYEPVVPLDLLTVKSSASLPPLAPPMYRPGLSASE